MPTPVPNVTTSSRPFPLITPNPCRSASFRIRTGLPKSFFKPLAKSKPCQLLFSKVGAVMILPLTTTPGKPTETRSYRGREKVSSLIAFRIVWGVAGRGVLTRRNLLETILPLKSTTAALIPLPPISMVSVIGLIGSFFFVPLGVRPFLPSRNTESYKFREQ